MRRVNFVDRFRIDKPNKFRLSKCDPADTCGLDLDKKEAKELLGGRHRPVVGAARASLRPGSLRCW
jgi:hypothetical protein